MSRPFTAPEERFWIKVKKTKTCWIWTACTDGNGYGAFSVPKEKGSKAVKAYRFSYELRYGPVPKGLELDHLCRNKICVNPEHLEAVSHKENVMRGDSFMARKAKQTHCIHGHKYTKQNTLRHHGRRSCRACTRTPEAREAGRLRMRKWRKNHPLPRIT